MDWNLIKGTFNQSKKDTKKCFNIWCLKQVRGTFLIHVGELEKSTVAKAIVGCVYMIWCRHLILLNKLSPCASFTYSFFENFNELSQSLRQVVVNIEPVTVQ